MNQATQSIGSVVWGWCTMHALNYLAVIMFVFFLILLMYQRHTDRKPPQVPRHAVCGCRYCRTKEAKILADKETDT